MLLYDNCPVRRTLLYMYHGTANLNMIYYNINQPEGSTMYIRVSQKKNFCESWQVMGEVIIK